MTDPEPAAASDEELQTTITGPENAAPDSPQRNRPQWPDLPVDDDTANVEKDRANRTFWLEQTAH